jgi:hypothetical protein
LCLSQSYEKISVAVFIIFTIILKKQVVYAMFFRYKKFFFLF